METWKSFRDSDYEVSDQGRVRSMPRNITRSDGKPCTVKGRILKPATDNKGYLRTAIIYKGKLSTFKVHRMVAECFIPNPDNLPQVNHRWGNKKDNRASELEWCNNSRNIKHAYDTGLIKNIYEPVKDKSNFKRGVQNSESKLTPDQVLSARSFRESGHTYQDIADMFGVCKKTMMHAIKGVTWKQI